MPATPTQTLPRPEREIRAVFDAGTITVYQAFRPEIAEPAALAGRFGIGFSLDRMTWIKPSFLWMMHRSGWASKEGQERVLSIRIARDGFEWALSHSALSRFEPASYRTEAEWRSRLASCPARVQWDPERDLRGNALPWRSLQLGLEGEAARRYAHQWIQGIDDITPEVRRLRALLEAGRTTEAEAALPREVPYPIADGLGG